MSPGPLVESHVTQHTVWQALSGQRPPFSLAPVPLTPAHLDSRDARPGSLFVALAGSRTDGHAYIGQAIAGGAAAVICEARGLEALQESDAYVVRCDKPKGEDAGQEDASGGGSTDLRHGRCIGYVVSNTVEALQAIGSFQRIHRTRANLRVIGVTGSVGKTSSKELAAAVLRQRFRTYYSPGNLNSEEGLPLALMGLDYDAERAVLEMGMYAPGEIELLCTLARPHVGVVTNVGPVHLERLGSIEAIAEAKQELVASLPSAANGGVAILNWDDERVRSMANATRARLFRYGLTPEADLWADQIESAGLEGIRFRFCHRDVDGRIHHLYIRVPLLGRHSVHTALRAAAVGLAEGLTWQEIAAGLQRSEGHLRLVAVPGINGSTVIDDTYNASPASTLAALNLLDDLGNGSRRRVAVLGDMRELGSFTEEGHRQVGIRAAAVADLLIVVGELGRIIADEAEAIGLTSDRIYTFEDPHETIHALEDLICPDDFVLVKGSRAVGMDTIVSGITIH